MSQQFSRVPSSASVYIYIGHVTASVVMLHMYGRDWEITEDLGPPGHINTTYRKNTFQSFRCLSLTEVSVSRDFFTLLLHESNPPRSLNNRQKWLCWKICFRGDIREMSDSALTNTAGSVVGILFFFAALFLPWKRIYIYI